MKNFSMAFRSLFKKGRNNGIKIIALAVGLAMGLVLIAKVCFERSYDNFYPDNDRIYLVKSGINREGKKDTWGQVSGAIAPGMKAEIPEVEAATRYTRIGSPDELIMTPEKQFYTATLLLTDTSFFDVFPRPILIGDPKDVLARPNYVMISRSLAEKMGGVESAVGKTFVRDVNRNSVQTIGGVFEDIPENSHLQYDMLGSLAGYSVQSTTNWVGNDRYVAYVKLLPGTTPESLAPSIRRMQERNQDLEGLKKAGVDLFYTISPLQDIHNNNEDVKDMNAMLLFLATILIVIAVLNYILVVISTLIGRTKEVAVHKCYGASGKDILGMILSESLLHLLLALLLGAFLILVFRGKVEDLLSASLSALFTLPTVTLLAGICLVVFGVTCLVPTWLFLRIPVASAFRSVKESKRYWKLCLLFVQFVATAYLVALLITISRQYDKMITSDPGYAYENLIYCNTTGVGAQERERAIDELRRLPQVDQVGCSTELPFYYASGNNVSLPGEDRELFNIADMYFVSDNYFKIMEIPVVEGKAFQPGEANDDKVMVSRKFVDLMEKTAGWTGSPLDKGVMITEHSNGTKVFTISGVYEDFRIGSLKGPDTRASVLFYNTPDSYNPAKIILIKMHTMSSENLAQINEILAGAMPDKVVEASVYKMDILNQYQDDRDFRDSIMISGLVTLIIALIGLLGYTADETNRRGREIAIRKVNGATAIDILRMISKDISYIAIPALAIGAAIAYVSASGWLEKFAERIHLSAFIFIGAALFVYVIIIGCVLFRAWRTADENPVESLKAD
ncbi:FtsX-like permease family protein [Parabacteroides goldsteinii]|nr:ABC transporter permease [Parabacteroides goldsteinii]TFU77038.1 FtsX-like permease family protein [Parabacteroides sp. P14]MRX91989.1 FtsX-like permease family protein [Parabacteroides goldsteinii]MRX97469.1 FtsX-like permease family protein [Parabacteroides goldsteinii]MRY02577.1 FtsX-like permease family protein [Parabacteroides goldsteinii]